MKTVKHLASLQVFPRNRSEQFCSLAAQGLQLRDKRSERREVENIHATSIREVRRAASTGSRLRLVSPARPARGGAARAERAGGFASQQKECGI